MALSLADAYAALDMEPPPAGLSEEAVAEHLSAVKKRFKKLALLHHPDKGGSLEKMQDLTAAYEKITSDEPDRDDDDDEFWTFDEFLHHVFMQFRRARREAIRNYEKKYAEVKRSAAEAVRVRNEEAAKTAARTRAAMGTAAIQSALDAGHLARLRRALEEHASVAPSALVAEARKKRDKLNREMKKAAKENVDEEATAKKAEKKKRQKEKRAANGNGNAALACAESNEGPQTSE